MITIHKKNPVVIKSGSGGAEHWLGKNTHCALESACLSRRIIQGVHLLGEWFVRQRIYKTGVFWEAAVDI